MPVFYDHTQYSGIWTLDQVGAAMGQSLWPTFGNRLFSWGRNSNGQLGLNNLIYYSSPKQVGALTNWSKIINGAIFSVALKTDGTLWTWGQNNYGQLGLGNRTYYSSPKQVGALTTWLNIAAGYHHTAAIKTDGTLWTWGGNTPNLGQLGLGNNTNYSSPKQVGALTNWLNIACGYSHTIALKTDGTLWTWGRNNNGQLGLGNRTYYSSPKQVGALTTWSNIVWGIYYYTIALKTDGTLWTWGNNSNGQLGLGNTTYYSSPKQVGALTTWLGITSGYASTLGIQNNGTLWAWGRNIFGQLGLGNRTYYSSPKQVGALTTWSSIAGGEFYTTSALKTDGTLWTWGHNNFGQLGLGNRTDYSSPKQMGSLTSWISIAGGGYYTTAIARY